jgi:hypothetical protein
MSWLSLTQATTILDHDVQRGRASLERAISKAWIVGVGGSPAPPIDPNVPLRIQVTPSPACVLWDEIGWIVPCLIGKPLKLNVSARRGRPAGHLSHRLPLNREQRSRSGGKILGAYGLPKKVRSAKFRPLAQRLISPCKRWTRQLATRTLTSSPPH